MKSEVEKADRNIDKSTNTRTRNFGESGYDGKKKNNPFFNICTHYLVGANLG